MNSQYLDYIKWQSELLSGEKGIQLRRYWENYLATAPTHLNLPIDYPRPTTPSYCGDVYLDSLNTSHVKQIREFGRANETNPFTILLAILSIFLSRICRQEDLSIGVPLMSSWLDPDRSKTVVGMLANLVLCQINLRGNPPFNKIIQQVSTALEEIEPYRDFPFVEVANYLKEQHDGVGNVPPIQVAFSWEIDPHRDIADSDKALSIEPYVLGEQGGGAFDIYLTVMEVGENLHFCWKYSTDLFRQETIMRFAQQFKTLLTAAITQPAKPFAYLPLLSETERHLLLTAQPQPDLQPQPFCAHQLFEAQVKRTPDKVAVVYEGEELTYHDLNQAANQLAYHLQTLGIQPETLVGIFMPRCLEMIVGLLAVLKTGAAYVPIDPDYPQERLAYILADSQVSILLVKQPHLEKVPSNNAPIISVDWDREAISRQPTTNPSSLVTLDNLAYVIYTSGSTGKPKGVMIEHRALTNFVQQACHSYDITERDRILQFASFSFDAAVEEIYPCLISGGTLILRPEGLLDSIPTFLKACQEYALTLLDLPTAYWHLLVEVLTSQPHLSLPSTLRCVIIGGERANPYCVQQWVRYVGTSLELINTYGPTEATVVATTYRLSSATPTDSAAASPKQPELPIGKALGNITTYVLDNQQQLVPPGLPGELCLGGVALARGYLHCPELTQKSFISNPFSINPEDRLYRTGDLVRYLPDGNLEFLGRIDHQVKIRGFRVDLGEIELAINSYPGISQVFVMAQPDCLGHQQLVAYMVSELIPDRIPYQTECWLEYSGQLVKLTTLDISSQGVGLLDVPSELCHGDAVRICFLLPLHEDKHWFEGTVVWHQGTRIGIQIKPIENEPALLQQSAAYMLESQGILKALQRTIAGAMRKYLKQKLPDYMIPASCVLVDALPLTPNGKVDRRKLPSPNFHQPEPSTSEATLPRNHTERTIAEIWSQLLGIAQITSTDNFFDLGGNSLLAIQFINLLNEQLQIDIPVWMLVKHPTIATLATAIADQEDVHPSLTTQLTQSLDINLEAEAKLDPVIQYSTPHDTKTATSPASILLTGPTGFVGPYLLSELLQQTEADVFCLLRYRPGQTGRQRIEAQLKAHGLWHEAYRRRIIAVIGDLTEPLLGLSESQFEDLANSVGIIYHNGAWVNFVYPYSSLRAANVQGTQEVLRLASRAKTKPVHFISTLSVFSDAYADKELVLETDIPQRTEHLQSGYDQSKWVAEKLVQIAQQRGLPATIYRLGTLLGHSQTGITNKPNDFFCSLIKGCLQLGKAPVFSSKLNLTPVDYVSQAIVHIAQQSDYLGQTLHIINPHPISWENLVDCICANGYSLEVEPYPQWLSQLKQQIQAGHHNELAAFLPVLSSAEELPLEKPNFDASLSQGALSRTPVVCPIIDTNLMKMYLAYFSKKGNFEVSCV